MISQGYAILKNPESIIVITYSDCNCYENFQSAWYDAAHLECNSSVQMYAEGNHGDNTIAVLCTVQKKCIARRIISHVFRCDTRHEKPTSTSSIPTTSNHLYFLRKKNLMEKITEHTLSENNLPGEAAD